MKYIAGSLIISFGLLFIGVVLSNAMGIKAGDDLFTYLGVAWLVLAAMVYPFSKNLILLSFLYKCSCCCVDG